MQPFFWLNIIKIYVYINLINASISDLVFIST
jgi:hypothetical protein